MNVDELTAKAKDLFYRVQKGLHPSRATQEFKEFAEKLLNDDNS